MSNLKILGVGAACAFLLVACANGPYPQSGLIFHNVKGPNHAVPGPAGNKQGVSCATNILNYVAWGDASIDSAKKDAKLAEVSSVDYSSFGVLGVYTRTCAIVSGT